MFGVSLSAQAAGNGLPNTAQPRGSFFKSAPQNQLDRSKFSNQALALIPDTDWQEILAEAGFEFGPISTGSNTYRAQVQASPLALPKREHASLTQAGLPKQLDQAYLEMVLKLSKPWSANALKNGALSSIDLNRIQLVFDDMTLTGTGHLDVDKDTLMQGEITTSVTNWRRALDLVNFSSDTQRNAVASILGVLANGNTVEFTFQVKDSYLMLGPLSLTKIPSLADSL